MKAVLPQNPAGRQLKNSYSVYAVLPPMVKPIQRSSSDVPAGLFSSQVRGERAEKVGVFHQNDTFALSESECVLSECEDLDLDLDAEQLKRFFELFV